MSTAIRPEPIPVVTVPSYKRRQASTALNWKRDRLEKAEYEPDNSRIGRESSGIQSNPDTDNRGTYEQVKAATLRRLLLSGAGFKLNQLAGIVPMTIKVARVQAEAVEPLVPHHKFIGPETETEYKRNQTRQVVKGQPVSGWMLDVLAAQTKNQHSEVQKGKSTWQPKQGQRPVVLLQKV